MNQIQDPNDESERVPDRSALMTERRLAESMELDRLSTLDALAVMNEQDALAVEAVKSQRAEVARAVEMVAAALMSGGKADLCGGGNQRKAWRAGCDGMYADVWDGSEACAGGDRGWE